MSKISAATVKELREKTGAGLMECKGALVETDGDVEKASNHSPEAGRCRRGKKSGPRNRGRASSAPTFMPAAKSEFSSK